MQTISLKKKVKLFELKYAKEVLIKPCMFMKQQGRKILKASILQKHLSLNKSQAACNRLYNG